MKNRLVHLCTFCFIILTGSAFGGDLPIELRASGEKYTVTNVSDCIIYKLTIRSVPPKKEGAGNFLSRFGAEVAGIGSFSKSLGKIEKNGSVSFVKSDLTNANGKKLNDEYIIGSFIFEGSSCGECGLSKMFNAE